MKKIIEYVFILTCTLSLLSGYSQNSSIDSLKLALKNAKHDTIRIKLLLNISEEIYLTNPDSDFVVCSQALELSKKSSEEETNTDIKKIYLKQYAHSLNNVGFIFLNKGDVPKATENFKKAIKIQDLINNRAGKAVLLINLGSIYESQGDIAKALEYFFSALKTLEELSDKVGVGNALSNIGLLYKNQNDLEKALEFYERSLKVRTEINDEHGIAFSLHNIGNVYGRKRKFKEALNYFYKSLQISEKTNDKEGIAMSLNTIAFTYFRTGDPSCTKSNEECTKISRKKATEFYERALRLREELGDKEGIALTLNSLSELLRNTGQLNKAVEYSERSLQIAKELAYPDVIGEAATGLKRNYLAQNKYKEAFEMYELEIKMRDSINNQETQKAAVKKQMQYDFEKKEAVTNAEHKFDLEKQQAVAEEKSRKQKIIIGSVIAGLVLVLVFAIFIFRSLNITRKQKLLIEIKNKETEAQKHEIEEKQKEIIDSITYARRIQRALITPEKYIEKSLNRLID